MLAKPLRVEWRTIHADTSKGIFPVVWFIQIYDSVAIHRFSAVVINGYRMLVNPLTKYFHSPTLLQVPNLVNIIFKLDVDK